MPGWFEENVEGYQPDPADWRSDPNVQSGGYAGPPTGPVLGPGEEVAAQMPQQAPDRSSWNTKGYATPGYVAGNAGPVLGGFDADKWNDPNYQDPKYVFGRILQEASGGTGALKDPAQRQSAVDNIMKAYPGASFDGKDKIRMPDGAIIDIFGGAGAGNYSATFQVQEGTARDPQGNLLPVDRGSMGGGMPNPGFGGGGGGGGFSGFGGYGGGGGFQGYQGDPYAYQDITAPTDYTPVDTAGPQAYTPERVSTPGALSATDIAGADPFKAPTAEEMMADPGYQVRLDRGSKAFMANKAAAGVARTGGALKQLADYNQDSASQEYGNVYNRRFGEYTTGLQDRLAVGNSNNANRAQAYGLSNDARFRAEAANQGAGMNAWQAYQGMNQQNQQFNAGRRDTANQQNFANRFGVAQANNAGRLAGWQANTNAQLGFGGLANQRDLGFANVGLGYHQADQSYDLGMRNNALGYYSAGNSYALGNAANQLGWANYGLNAQGQGFNQQYSLANMGLNAAGMYGNYAGQYGQNGANNATGAGNARAGGTVGSANAWNQGMGGAYNTAMGAYDAYQQRPRSGGLYLDPSQGGRV